MDEDRVGKLMAITRGGREHPRDVLAGTSHQLHTETDTVKQYACQTHTHTNTTQVRETHTQTHKQTNNQTHTNTTQVKETDPKMNGLKIVAASSVLLIGPNSTAAVASASCSNLVTTLTTATAGNSVDTVNCKSKEKLGKLQKIYIIDQI